MAPALRNSVTGNTELISEFTLHIRAERGLSVNTVSAYVSDLWQYAEVLETRGAILFTATKDDVAHFIQHLATHDIGPRSRARKIAALRRLYRWLILNERIDLDPTRLTVLPKLPRLLPRPVEPGVLQTLLASSGTRASADDATALELRDHAILETLYGGGVRVSELCGIRQADLDTEAGTTHVYGKGGKERIVPIGDAAVSAIGNYLRFGRPQLAKSVVKSGRKKTALFLSLQGTQITRQRVYQIVARAGGEDHVHPHRLRHTCATDVLRAGADLRMVQELLGHANPGTTQIYTQVTKDHLQKDHARFHPRGRG